jgi:TRAP-type C4-dicarboxylate transport system permease small subunit
MKEEVEEPFRKNGRSILTLALLLLFLLVTGVLLVSWYLGDVRQGAETIDLKQLLISLLAVLTLIVLLIVLLINLLRKQKKANRRKAPVKRSASPTEMRKKRSTQRKSVSKQRV